MRKIFYQQPHVIVREISPELMQGGGGIVINSGEEPLPGDDSDAKFNDFDDDKGFSDNIWED